MDVICPKNRAGFETSSAVAALLKIDCCGASPNCGEFSYGFETASNEVGSDRMQLSCTRGLGFAIAGGICA
jgi:hypothetical protein